MKHLKTFWDSIIITVLCLAAAAWWGQHEGNSVVTVLYTVIVLGIMEVALSFDNAVINATKLKYLSTFWQKFFLRFGILVAVFGMRFAFPIEIVAVTTGQGFMDVLHLSMDNPKEYSRLLLSHHGEIAFFGGAFLFMIFFGFLFDNEKEHHWLGGLERKIAALGKVDAISTIATLALVFGVSHYLPEDQKSVCFFAGVLGVFANLLVGGLESLFDTDEDGASVGQIVVKTGMAALATVLYLEVLDASFSFDGVIGAFAVTNDVITIMLGLAIGAAFVRSLTVFLVETGAINEFAYLEHGASYAIGALSIIMFASVFHHLPEWIPATVSVFLIGASLYSSIRKNKLDALVEAVKNDAESDSVETKQN